MSTVLIIVACFLGVFGVLLMALYLIGLWSTKQRVSRARAKYGNLMPVISAMANRTQAVRRLPGYHKLDVQMSKEEVRGLFNKTATIQAVELPDGQIWTRDDM